MAFASRRKLRRAERAAYGAPFHTRAAQAGARAFPALVPTDSDDPAMPEQGRAWERLGRFQKPFLTAYDTGDPILGKADHRAGRRDAVSMLPPIPRWLVVSR